MTTPAITRRIGALRCGRADSQDFPGDPAPRRGTARTHSLPGLRAVRIALGVLVLLASLAAGVTGCKVGPDFAPPPAASGTTFRGAQPGPTNSLGDLPWWQLFKQPELRELITVALTNNQDLRAATARVEQSRQALAQSRAAFLPQVGYEAGLGEGRNVVAGQPSDIGGGSGKGNDIAGTVAWEIDLWGRIRRLTESARAQMLATQETRRDVTISLVARVAESYFTLLALDEELAIAQRATNSFAESRRLFDERLHGGVASRLEIATASAALASAAATIPDLRRQIAARENELAVLLGREPGPIPRPVGALAGQVPPAVPPGLPSALLERRPDIRRATQLLRSANARIGAAKADFYPRISLTGLFGEVSPELIPFTSGAVSAWSLAGNLAGPVFQGGRLRAQLREARAAWEEAGAAYEGTVLNAFREVSDALITGEEVAAQTRELERAVTAWREAVEVAGERYRAGQSSYYELLQAQEALYPAETALTQAALSRLLTSVQLYKALGGGWEPAQP